MQKTRLGEEEEEGGGPAKRKLADEAEDEVVGFDEADWDKQQQEMPFL